MIDKDYRHRIGNAKDRKAYWRKKYQSKEKKPVRWVIILGAISTLSIGVGLALYGRELPAYPTPPLAQTNHLTSETITSHQHTSMSPSATSERSAITTANPSPRSAQKPYTWQNITVEKGDNLSRIFSQLGLSPRQVYAVMSLGESVHSLENLQPGQLLQIAIKGNTDHRQLTALRLNFSPISYLEVRAEEGGLQAKQVTRNVDTHIETITGTIETSLFEDGLQAGLTNRQIIKLTQIFGWDIDFALDLRSKDSFKVLFEERYLQGKKVKNGPILAAEFTNRGKTFRAIRHTDANGNIGYYTPKGLNMRKAFLRTPVNYSRISSYFNLKRKHPILNRIRAHKGVDYAAPIGTPIKAAGDGKVTFVGRKGGYGKAIVLQHGTKYSTLYGHLSAFKRGLKIGMKVEQGEIIGYVGQTGLATGPHLHYEFLVNGIHRDPLTVKLPQANPIPAPLKQKFQTLAARLVGKLEAASKTTVVLNQ